MKMIATLRQDTTGWAWPGYVIGKSKVEIDSDDVVAWGRLANYRSYITRMLVKMKDGTEHFLTQKEQTEDVQRFLRKVSKKMDSPFVNRDCEEAVKWTVVL